MEVVRGVSMMRVVTVCVSVLSIFLRLRTSEEEESRIRCSSIDLISLVTYYQSPLITSRVRGGGNSRI